ncbi:MAG: hypothetical protein U5L09_12790 [Bacteroidales bacterium]|nr:hypothetical protein [Bacteroidales bacterium]
MMNFSKVPPVSAFGLLKKIMATAGEKASGDTLNNVRCPVLLQAFSLLKIALRRESNMIKLEPGVHGFSAGLASWRQALKTPGL